MINRNINRPENENRIDLEVIEERDINGKVTPLYIKWPDKEPFKIDQAKNLGRSANIRVGVSGIKYKCIISGQIRYLYLDHYGWCMEKLK